MKLPTTILRAGLLWMLATPAFAQGPAPDVEDLLDRVRVQLAQVERDRTRQIEERTAKAIEKAHAAVERTNVHLMLHGLGTREVVKNAPFTADVVYRTEQVLADGNRITRTSESTYARDSEGRTRQQRGAKLVRIEDPVAKRSYLLEPDAKLAIALPEIPTPPAPPGSKRPPPPPSTGSASSPPTPPTPPAPPGAEERRVEVRPGRVIVERRTAGEPGEVRVEVVRIARGNPADDLAPLPPLAPGTEPGLPPLTLHGQPLNLPLAERGKGVTEKLGTRDVEGVRAEGTRTTWTVAAGAIGNEKPIVSTSEQWYSPDLHTTVLARTSDPRSGETTYRLANIRRAEPSPDLFRVPSDYRER